jgi:hypothetical protein
VTTVGLPRSAGFLGTDDCGPDDGSWPHCRVPCRHVIHLQVEDGQRLGAMRGVVQLFLVAELARQYGYLKVKEAWHPAQRPSWKLSARDAEGYVDAQRAISRARAASVAAAWARSRGRR